MKHYVKSNLCLLALICLSACAATVAQEQLPYAISGDVHDGAGRRIGGVRVCAFPVQRGSEGLILCGVSDVEGRFKVKVAEAGTYMLLPDKKTDGYMIPYLPFYRHSSVPILEATVDEKHTSASVSVLLGPKNGTLAGRSVDMATGLPVENVRFVLCHAASPQLCLTTNAKDTGGKFNILTPHVPFILKISAEGYEDWFGLRGTDKEEAISVASGAKTELPVYLNRRRETKNLPLNDREKLPGINLPAPIQLSPADNVKLDYTPRITKLEWSPVEGATTYTVEIDYCRGGREYEKECINPQPFKLEDTPPMNGIVKTTYEFNFLGAQPGRWRVWAVDKKGREGFKSPWRAFFYLQ